VYVRPRRSASENLSRSPIDDDGAQHQRNLGQKYVVAKDANSTRPATVTAMAAATAMFRVANSVASVNRSDGDASLAVPINQPARNAATNVAHRKSHGVAQRGSEDQRH
jgi:hypothetical protein